jgi:hypothetical protein
VVCQDCEPEKKELRNHAHRTVPAGFPLRLLWSVDFRPGLDWVPDDYKIKARNGKVYNR